MSFFCFRKRVSHLHSSSLITYAVYAASMIPICLFGQPRGVDIKRGSAALKHDGPLLEIIAEDGSILNWEQFSIGEGERTLFSLPSSSSAVLNRVLGRSRTDILGALESNGAVFLINPNGIFIGKQGSINVGALTASTLDVLDDDFIQNQKLHFAGLSQESIVNYGLIQADGSILLAGKEIINFGQISSESIYLAAGQEVFFDPAGRERIVVSESYAEHPYEFAIKSSGEIIGIEEAFLDSGENGIEIGGGLQVSGKTAVLQGRHIHLNENAFIDVSGENGGGSVFIGGNREGEGIYGRFVESIQVDQGACINADSLKKGDGGNVVLWGRNWTSFKGSISAQGGLIEGNGGFVEISSRGSLVPSGSVSTKAENGLIGTLLFDPCIVTISSMADMGVSPVPPPTVGPYDYTFGVAVSGNINNTSLAAFLDDNNVTINASGPSGGAAVGSITVDDLISWNPPLLPHTVLTLQAATITVNASITSLKPGVPSGTPVLIFDAPIVDIGSSGSLADIVVSCSSGDINLNNLDQATLTAGTDTTVALKTATGGNLLIDGDIVINGGITVASDAIAAVSTLLGGTITVNGDLTVNGGTGGAMNRSAQASLSTIDGPILILGDVNVNGGSSNIVNGDAEAIVQTNTSSITINGITTVKGGMGNGASATGFIRTNLAGGTIVLNNDVSAEGGTGNSSEASGIIRTLQSTGPAMSILGNVVCRGGTANAGNASGLIGPESGTGDLFIQGDVTAIGGTCNTAGFDANGIVGNNLGPMTGGSFTLVCTDVLLQGGMAVAGEARASISVRTGGTTNITAAGDVVLIGGTADAGSATSSISVTHGGDLFITANSVSQNGGTGFGAGTGTSSALIGSSGPPGSIGNITISLSGPMTMVGNQASSIGTNSAEVLALRIGEINIIASDLTMTAGIAPNSRSAIETQSGNINIFCQNRCLLNGSVAESSIQTFGSDLTIVAGADISLTGASTLAVTAPTGNLLAIAGTDLFLGTGSLVSLDAVGNLTLVCDNLFPTPPLFGLGAFTIEAGATIQHLQNGPVRIFTVQPGQNTIDNLINGVTFNAGPIFTDSNQERWCIYYFDPFFGGPGFTLFYKICQDQLIQSTIVAQEEALMRFNLFDTYFDAFYVQFNVNYEDWFKTGFSLPYRDGYATDLNLFTPVQGYSFRRHLYSEVVGRTPEPELLDPPTFIAAQDEEDDEIEYLDNDFYSFVNKE